MHIKDLKMDVDLDGSALAAIRGGAGPSAFCSTEPGNPALPTFGGDRGTFSADIKSYIGDIKAGAGFPDYSDIAVDTDTATVIPDATNMPGNFLK